MRRFSKRPYRLDNQGAGIVTVLVSMMLVLMLASTLLFTSYTSLQIKVSERKSKENFYSAETAMTEVRSGIQQVVTESIAQAYSDVLIEYNTSVNTEDAFREKFKLALLNWTCDIDGNNKTLFEKLAGGAWVYHPEVLESFIEVSQQDAITFNCGSAAVVQTDDAVVLQGITLSYNNKEYLTNISTDMSIALPDFTYTLTEYSLTGIPEFAMIARESLTQDMAGFSQLELYGNAYAGNIQLIENNSTLAVSGGRLISGGNVTVSGTGYGSSPRFVLGNGSSLWANRIVVNTNSSVKLDGDIYVADDLELAGNEATAVLSGRYYGFGYLDNTEINTNGSSKNSSSIIVNGLGTTLDLSKLSTLMLAGQSFIRVGGDEFNDVGVDVLMGQSISVKSDQLAYLVPAQCLSVDSNPYIFSGDLSYTINKDIVLWGNKTLRYYVSDFKVITSGLASTGDTKNIAYFYMDFATKDKANE